ncbi:DUF892 family protein [Rickettsiales endosymbiont of Stachyamoeba lipophora]|uniref:DUF892 family protein n=1 Tax=Rickettsiales endosymbiont of Stachyamoeba lipophora TaxID=2486578 RepID=UPI000F646660|nr:ferritin-like domain-containing protein [Rickettsiales endosymbiont of Stachyamoeba lipophora]AZL16248.1 ferritin-like domain-containing protein [Rickettsiales endosymbiont of Stachyamoeba lipophora]
MATMVGMQPTLIGALKDLVELDYDAVEAYEAAINRLENAEYRKKMTEFMDDHKRHIKDVTELLRKHGENAPTGPDSTKQWLVKGKVVLANLVGDKTILTAMHSNEIDTNKAYARMLEREDLFDDAVNILKRGLEDEKKHKAWLEQFA